MGLLNTLKKEYDDYKWSQEYRATLKKEYNTEKKGFSKKDTVKKNYFSKQLKNKGSTYSYNKSRYKPGLGLVK